jgi:TonB family protein
VGVRLLVARARSLLANAAAVWLSLVSGAFGVPRRPVVVTPVELAPLSAADWERNRAARPPPRSFEPKLPPPDERGTVVELPPEVPGAKPEPPPQGARFLAERNQRVEKESVSRYAHGHAGPVLPVPQAGSPGSAGAAAVAPGKKPEAEPQRLARAEKPRGEEIAPGEGPSLERRAGEPGGEGRRQRPGAERGEADPARPDLAVRPESIARVAGGPNMDGYGQAEEGEVTALNTREFKYATYMNRVRRRIGEAWYPKIDEAMRTRDPEGKSFFYKDRTVTLGVTLDLSGRVTDLRVLHSSNVDFFDRIALASVQQAQPFPNPPPGLFERDGFARFPFSFTVYPADRRGVLFWRPPVDE